MKKNLDHLPASRQDNLAHIVAVLRDEFEQVTGFATGKKKYGRILKIILFGSHATGKWVNDPAHSYVSDYDILVIVNQRELVEEYKIWHTAEDRIALRVRQPLNILVHTLEEVNDALVKGQYFFTDIKREGIILYETDKRELAEAGNLTPEEYKTIAEKHYKQWFESAKGFYRFYEVGVEENNLKGAAFQLHQAAEHLYACLLLVLTNYKPYTHNLKQLNSLAISQDERVAEVFPQESKVHRRRFQLLKNAYVDARYSEHYKITQDELVWLAERVSILQQLTENLCKAR
ncbi:MAG: HEPN domain-containing protein [Candidatus Thiosymbion ectosymbiont of Robbea hypermnestra]|nr:HEPN domain-containing protein [Candidatus Thiosymbion ectosymbiont of Robbea hypermnestra]